MFSVQLTSRLFPGAMYQALTKGFMNLGPRTLDGCL